MSRPIQSNPTPPRPPPCAAALAWILQGRRNKRYAVSPSWNALWAPLAKAWLMAEFDTIAKHLIHTYPYDFVRFALQRDDLEVLDIIDTEQPTVETHRHRQPHPRAPRRRRGGVGPSRISNHR